MNNISFNGKFVSNINIKKAGAIANEFKTSIVEINPYSKNDLKTLREVHELWRGHFSRLVYEEAVKTSIDKIFSEENKFFVMTMQRGNFDVLDGNDILAEAKIILNKPEKNYVYIDYLQVNPEDMHGSNYRVYKNIGTNFLNFFKENFSKKTIHLHTIESARTFYMKNGFQKDPKISDHLYFKA